MGLFRMITRVCLLAMQGVHILSKSLFGDASRNDFSSSEGGVEGRARAGVLLLSLEPDYLKLL